jgi:hypothetical protein
MSDSDDLLLPGTLEIVVKTASGDRHVVSIPAEFGLKEIRRRVAGAFAQPGEPEEEGEQDEAEHHVHVDPSSEENKMIVQANKVKEEAPAHPGWSRAFPPRGPRLHRATAACHGRRVHREPGSQVGASL